MRVSMSATLPVIEQAHGQTRVNSRRALARQRSDAALAALGSCDLCARHCHVDRLRGEHGFCGAGTEARVFSAQLEVSDELELIPVFAIALSGCDLRCSFCITGAPSWRATAGEPLNPSRLGEAAQLAIHRGARSVMILGGEPTIHLPAVLELVAHLPEDVRLIWKTNGHGTAVSRRLLSGLFDLWLVDYKFGNDSCAQRLAAVPNYSAVVQENLLWAGGQSAGSTREGVPGESTRAELLVRHLLMPGHVHCCWEPVAAWLAEHLPFIKVNLRTGFWPAWKAARHPELRSIVTAAETAIAMEIAQNHRLHLVE